VKLSCNLSVFCLASQERPFRMNDVTYPCAVMPELLVVAHQVAARLPARHEGFVAFSTGRVRENPLARRLSRLADRLGKNPAVSRTAQTLVSGYGWAPSLGEEHSHAIGYKLKAP
jgi:hypothetical protein